MCNHQSYGCTNQQKKLSVRIVPNISSALRYLGVIFDRYILSRGYTLAGADCAGDVDSCYGT